MQLVILFMGAAEGTFDFDLELKKRSSVATILGKNSYTFNWIPMESLPPRRLRLAAAAAPHQTQNLHVLMGFVFCQPVRADVQILE